MSVRRHNMHGRWRLVLIGLVVSLLPFTAAGHDRRVIEGSGRQAFLLESWFRDEPPELNQENALVLAVRNVGTDGAGPVRGVETTIQAELRGGGERVPLSFTPLFSTADSASGALTSVYEASFLATAPGNYRVRLTGEIEGVSIDVMLFSHAITSSWFDPLAIPEQAVSNRDREWPEATPGPIGASPTATTTEDRPQTYVGIAGMTLGLLAGSFALWQAAKRYRGGAEGAK